MALTSKKLHLDNIRGIRDFMTYKSLATFAMAYKELDPINNSHYKVLHVAYIP
jgi:hypothetical protein